MWINEFVVRAPFHCVHKRFRQADGQIEVVELILFLLGVDELEDVGVIHTEDAHIGSSPLPALLNLLGGRIEDFQKRNRTGSHAARGSHPAVARTQARKGKAGAAAGLVDHRRELHGIKDFLDGISHRKHKAGCELAERRARIHERG